MLKRDLKPFVMKEDWQVPFLRREIIKDQYDNYFSGNGYYPNEGNYDTDIRLNLQVFHDANKRITSMSYYKVHDLTMGHGKPVLRDAELSKNDKAVFSKALSACTVSSADDELEHLLNKALKKKLPDGWKVDGYDKRSVVFSDEFGRQIRIPRTRICKAIDISHNYLEALSYKEFWEANPGSLNLEDADPLIALFSYVDPSQYYEYDLLLSKSNERVAESEITARFELIKEAAANGNDREINKQLKMIPQERITGESLAGALWSAVKNQHESLARKLVKLGADINSNYSYKGKNNGPLFFAMDNGWDSFLAYCLKQGFDPSKWGNENLVSYALDIGRKDMAITLLKAGARFTPLVRSKKVDPELVPQLLKYKSVDWGVMDPKWALESVDNDSFKYIVKHLKDEEGYTGSQFYSVVMMIGDPDLTEYYMNHCTPELCFTYYYDSKQNTDHRKAWAPYYAKALSAGEEKRQKFVETGMTVCCNHRDARAVAYLINELHTVPDEKQIQNMIPWIKYNYKESIPLVHSLLSKCHFTDDGEWHGVSSYSEQDRHDYKVSKSQVKELVRSVLSECDDAMCKIILENQQNLLEEPWAFRDFYDAAKWNHDKEVQAEIYKVLKPTAEKILSLYHQDSTVIWQPDHAVRDLVKAAKALLNMIK